MPTVEHAVKSTYLRRQRQPMQMTVMQIIKAAPAITTMTTKTAMKQQHNHIN